MVTTISNIPKSRHSSRPEAIPPKTGYHQSKGGKENRLVNSRSELRQRRQYRSPGPYALSCRESGGQENPSEKIRYRDGRSFLPRLYRRRYTNLRGILVYSTFSSQSDQGQAPAKHFFPTDLGVASKKTTKVNSPVSN